MAAVATTFGAVGLAGVAAAAGRPSAADGARCARAWNRFAHPRQRAMLVQERALRATATVDARGVPPRCTLIFFLADGAALASSTSLTASGRGRWSALASFPPLLAAAMGGSSYRIDGKGQTRPV